MPAEVDIRTSVYAIVDVVWRVLWGQFCADLQITWYYGRLATAGLTIKLDNDFSCISNFKSAMTIPFAAL